MRTLTLYPSDNALGIRFIDGETTVEGVQRFATMRDPEVDELYFPPSAAPTPLLLAMLQFADGSTETVRIQKGKTRTNPAGCE